jgi:peptide/nickel transport system permease protein
LAGSVTPLATSGLGSAEAARDRRAASAGRDFAAYLTRKLATAVVSFAMLLVVGFILFSLIPSNPVEALTRGRPDTSAKQIAFLTQQLGLNLPVWDRFAHFVGHTVTGNLGYSWQFQEPVATLIAQRVWPTLLLVGSATIVSVAVGMWLGIHSGWRPGSLMDRTSTGTAITFWSMPTFWLGIMLLVLFASGTGPFPAIFPAGGMSTPGTAGGLTPAHVLDVARHLVLPCLTLVLVSFGQYQMIMRSSVVDEMGNSYLLTARAKGLRDAEVRQRHAVPNALLPSVTVIFVQIGLVIGGVVTVETVYSWPGLGYLAYQALQIPDLPLLEGTFLVFSASVIFFNLVADVLYRYLDPRVRRQ